MLKGEEVITMAVNVYSTGSLFATLVAGQTVRINVNNRTTSIQTLRALLWNTSNGLSPKLLLAEQPVATIGANGAVNFLLTVPAAPATTAYEIEVRMSDIHMVATISQAGASFGLANKLPVLPGEFFVQFDPNGSV
jgi:hypothetical protein